MTVEVPTMEQSKATYLVGADLVKIVVVCRTCWSIERNRTKQIKQKNNTQDTGNCSVAGLCVINITFAKLLHGVC